MSQQIWVLHRWGLAPEQCFDIVKQNLKFCERNPRILAYTPDIVKPQSGSVLEPSLDPRTRFFDILEPESVHAPLCIGRAFRGF